MKKMTAFEDLVVGGNNRVVGFIARSFREKKIITEIFARTRTFVLATN